MSEENNKYGGSYNNYQDFIRHDGVESERCPACKLKGNNLCKKKCQGYKHDPSLFQTADEIRKWREDNN